MILNGRNYILYKTLQKNKLNSFAKTPSGVELINVKQSK